MGTGKLATWGQLRVSCHPHALHPSCSLGQPWLASSAPVSGQQHWPSPGPAGFPLPNSGNTGARGVMGD